jgi:hypothetical protein
MSWRGMNTNNRKTVKRRWNQFSVRTLLLAASIVAVVSALVAVRRQPSSQVPLLLRELANGPGGNVDLWYDRSRSDRARKQLDQLGVGALEPLIDCLDDPDYRIRYLAASQLGKIGDERATKPLLITATQDDEIVRKWAILALGECGTKDTIVELETFLDVPDVHCRECASRAIRKIRLRLEYKREVEESQTSS